MKKGGLMIITFYRSIILYLFITFFLRFTGKRQLGELSPSELVTTFIVSNIAAIPIENSEKSLLSGVVPIVVIFSLEIFMSFISLKFPNGRKIICGRSRYVIKNGKIDEKMMEKLRISIDDLEEELRLNGIFNLDEVDFAVAETNGKLSVYQKFDSRPASNKDMGNKSKGCEGPSLSVIKDGRIVQESLECLSIKEAWLLNKLSELNLEKEDILVMTCNKDGKIFYQRKSKR